DHQPDAAARINGGGLTRAQRCSERENQPCSQTEPIHPCRPPCSLQHSALRRLFGRDYDGSHPSQMNTEYSTRRGFLTAVSVVGLNLTIEAIPASAPPATERPREGASLVPLESESTNAPEP